MVDIHAVRQINGDLRIDDGDEGPLLTIQFFAEFASLFSTDEKDQILVAVAEKIGELMADRDLAEVSIIDYLRSLDRVPRQTTPKQQFDSMNNRRAATKDQKAKAKKMSNFEKTGF